MEEEVDKKKCNNQSQRFLFLVINDVYVKNMGKIMIDGITRVEIESLQCKGRSVYDIFPWLICKFKIQINYF